MKKYGRGLRDVPRMEDDMRGRGERVRTPRIWSSQRGTTWTMGDYATTTRKQVGTYKRKLDLIHLCQTVFKEHTSVAS